MCKGNVELLESQFNKRIIIIIIINYAGGSNGQYLSVSAGLKSEDACMHTKKPVLDWLLSVLVTNNAPDYIVWDARLFASLVGK